MKLLLKKASIIILSILLIIFFNLTTVQAEENIDINTLQHGYSFEVSNLKPGDWIPRDITVTNDGQFDFKYTVRLGETKSKKGLLDELEFLISQGSVVLYEGKVKGFKGLSPRELAAGSKEDLFFQVTMPYELGNEFQGSSAELEIIFLAEGKEDNTEIHPDPDKGNPDTDAVVTPEIVNKLPNTATNNYNLLFVGGLLICLGGTMSYLLFRRKRYDL
ncbi:LPXTG cell wall anchor domain-containing protein [Cytobacillus oceanisediminis]|jgi:LPXTG-motif cell wall-anchored protein|uniref:LPXTG cell wall anchor domain-containing protein n=1 Tax=Cytobacillus oceanisediminis TaxID=665099 RepID=UPI00119F527D|nr:LPXTG cell wall anchor domain-containing protein [Cytobacillus oceanisediminis]